MNNKTECPDWSKDEPEHKSPRIARVMLNVLRAAQAGALKSVPSCGDVARWHEISFHSIAPHPHYAGGFRQADPERPCLSRNVVVQDSVGVPYMGAHFKHVLELVEDLSQSICVNMGALELAFDTLHGQDRAKRIAIVVGRTIGAFIKIHPFLNGNGRMSRLLWSVLLYRLGYNYRMSIMQRPPLIEYGEAMEAAMKGNLSPVVALVLDTLCQPTRPSTALPLPPAAR